ncbi:cellulose 1,4-beta-cellobiosidase precursor [Flagelloscypha sp. PMI_526]|nr:cellulose 1,4-beta-cellobiosidase precursor [Flagelloscypha sp. PMI_526]
MSVYFLALAGLLVSAQKIGTFNSEIHPTLTIQQCDINKVCTTQNRSIVLDSNWRWVHSVNDTTNCINGNYWSPELCYEPSICASNCALDGADYPGTFGITTSGGSLTLKYDTDGTFGRNIASRVYLLEDYSHYQTFNLLNQEFTFDVDVSQLPCGLNGALYFVQMDRDGGTGRYPSNQAGAAYGTGYCDSDCPRNLEFVNGKANTLDWTPSPNDTQAGFGRYGSCCNEVDVWEANSMAAAYTGHPCSGSGVQTQCEGTTCGEGSNRYNGLCDKDGCDFNSYRMGAKAYLGAGKTIDTTRKITVTTQFLTSDNSSSGSLVEIRRLYKQNGVVIPNSQTNITGLSAYNSITDAYCTAQKTAFGDQNAFQPRGGLTALGNSFKTGMVLTLSISTDYVTRMLWLDSTYPADKPSAPGAQRGECSVFSGNPIDVEGPSPRVEYSNIKYGPIGST